MQASCHLLRCQLIASSVKKKWLLCLHLLYYLSVATWRFDTFNDIAQHPVKLIRSPVTCSSFWNPKPVSFDILFGSNPTVEVVREASPSARFQTALLIPDRDGCVNSFLWPEVSWWRCQWAVRAPWVSGWWACLGCDWQCELEGWLYLAGHGWHRPPQTLKTWSWCRDG